MLNNQFGYTLDNNGTIGVQGSPTVACGNYWSANIPCFTNVLNNTVPVPLSIWYCQSPSPPGKITFSPGSTNCFANSPGPYSWSTHLLPISATYSYPPDPANDYCENSGQLLSVGNNMSFDNRQIEAILKDSLGIMVRNFESKLDYFIIEKSGKLPTALSSVIKSWRESDSGKYFHELLSRIEKGLSSSQITAKGKYGMNNDFERSRVEFYLYFVNKFVNGGNFSYDEIKELHMLANSCPDENGAIVYYSRTLLDAIYIQPGDYVNDCSALNSRYISEKQTNSVLATIFPNPNSGQFKLELSGETNASFNITIFNAIGNVILKRSGKFTSDKELHEVILTEPGVYYCEILQSGKGKEIKKIIVLE